MKYNFDDLIVLDLANNHQGDVKHASEIITEIAEVAKGRKEKIAIKFQFRDLDTFIHPDYRDSDENKHIKRFLSTEMSLDDYRRLHELAKSLGLITMCTPFDEKSVDHIKDIGFDLIKVASCSAKDWPLLEKISQANLPTVFSTGGLAFPDVDNLVSLFRHRGVDFAIMHCVAIYPSPVDSLQLDIIERLIKRYSDVSIGWSTHEDPNELSAVSIAYAKGARIFERHVGQNKNGYTLNAYSSTPEQVAAWLDELSKAKKMCGDSKYKLIPDAETTALTSLKRGVYLAKNVRADTKLTLTDVFFAMPCLDGQLTSEQWSDGMKLNVSGQKNQPINCSDVLKSEPDEKLVLKTSIHEVKAMLNEASIALNSDFYIEFSHHYGIKNFLHYGAVIIDCVNRDYCKKLLLQLPGQHHPAHFHKRKEETFQVLSGVLEMSVDGKRKTLHPGDLCLVQPGVWHEFWTETGVIFEEISTTHYKKDSFYKDKLINEQPLSARKTRVNHWGRFELVEHDHISALTE